MGAVETARDALFGNPPVPNMEPSREGLLAAIAEIDRRVSSAVSGIAPYETIADLPASIDPGDGGKPVGAQARVYADPTDANNTYWIRTSASGTNNGWVVDQDYIDQAAAVVQPLVDQAEEARDVVLAATQNVTTRASERVGVSAIDSSRNLIGGFDPGEVAHHQIRAHDQAVMRQRADSRLDITYRLLASIAHILIYGQSLSIGTDAYAAHADAPDLGNALMHPGGIRAQDIGTNLTAKYGSAMVPLVNADSSQGGQTMAYSIIDMFCQLVLRENGIDLRASGQKFLASAPGQGSTGLSGLIPGTAPFTNLSNDITYGEANAVSAGESYQLLAAIIQHGQTDTGASTTGADFKTGWRGLGASIAGVAAGVDGLPSPMPMLLFGLSTFPTLGASNNRLNQAILEMCDEDADKFFVAPEYAFPFYGRANLHWSNAGQMLAGATVGAVLKRIIWDGIDPDRIRALAPAVQGDTVTIPFHVPTGTPLVVDESRWAPANYGVTLVQANGTTAITVSSVALVGGDRLKIRATSTLPSHFFVRIGNASNDVGPAAVTSIRDCQGDRIFYQYGGVSNPIHNWMPNMNVEVGA